MNRTVCVTFLGKQSNLLCYIETENWNRITEPFQSAYSKKQIAAAEGGVHHFHRRCRNWGDPRGEGAGM